MCSVGAELRQLFVHPEDTRTARLGAVAKVDQERAAGLVVPHTQRDLVASPCIHGRDILEFAGHGCARGSVQQLIAKVENLVKNV